VPFLSMLEHHRLSHSSAEVRLLYGLRSPDAAIGAAGLRRAGPRVRMTCVHSRQAPRDRDSATGRLDAAVLHAHVLGPASAPQMFVCGPTGFVESVADLLVGLGHAPASINTERLGDAA
jgi:ferredoxin-NADP reductase